jgi:hypothetical protein
VAGRQGRERCCEVHESFMAARRMPLLATRAPFFRWRGPAAILSLNFWALQGSDLPLHGSEPRHSAMKLAAVFSFHRRLIDRLNDGRYGRRVMFQPGGWAVSGKLLSRSA